MRPAKDAIKGTLVIKALPVCRAAREVSITPIATSPPSPIEPDETGSTTSAETMRVRVSKRQENSNLPLLTDSLITLLGLRKYTTDCFPEGKMRALLLHDFVVDVTEGVVAIMMRRTRLVVARGNKNVISSVAALLDSKHKLLC
jgi:hypothetical protein